MSTQYNALSVIGGWQTQNAKTGELLGPVFATTTDLWKWQAENIKTETIQKTRLSFDALTEKQKETLVEKHQDINVDGEYWHECTLDDFEHDLNIIGFDNVKIAYSGFCSQGDGLSFTGDYSPRASLEPEELYFAESIKVFAFLKQKHAYFSIVRFSHRYSHENTVTVSSDLDHRQEEQLLEACRDLMQDFYRILETEYDYQTSDAAVLETLAANGYEFDADTLEIV